MDRPIIYSFDSQKPVSNIPVDTPCFLMFGGYKTTTPHIAIYDLKQYNSLSQQYNVNANMYGIVYRFPAEHIGFVKSAVNINRTSKQNLCFFANTFFSAFFRKQVEYIFDTAVLPRIQFGDGTKLPVDTALQNMRNLTIFAHSYGVRMADYIDTKLSSVLSNLQYTPDEATKIHKQLVIISQSPSYLLYKRPSTVLNFASASDKTILYNSVFQDIYETTFIPEYNSVIAPSIYDDAYIKSKLKQDKDVEHRLWQMNFNKNLSVNGVETVQILKSTLCNSMKRDIITGDYSLLSNNEYYHLLYTLLYTNDKRNVNKLILNQSIHNYLFRHK